MKILPFSIVGLLLVVFVSCSDSDVPNDDTFVHDCSSDYASYTYGDNIFETKVQADQGEILTPNGSSCGIGAALDENNLIFTLRLFGEGPNLMMRAELGSLNEFINFSALEYTYNDTNIDEESLVGDHNNYILISSLDTETNEIEGEFSFWIKNVNDQIIMVENGTFTCNYHEF